MKMQLREILEDKMQMPSRTNPIFQLQKLADQIEALTAKMILTENIDNDLSKSIHDLATQNDVLQLKLRRHLVVSATQPANISTVKQR
jgi:hypothetical protein